MRDLLQKRFQLILIALLVLSSMGYFIKQLHFNTGYAPDQPIPFSHKLHAGDYKMDCLYCHNGAEKGKHATIPSMNVCMGCHSVVAVDSTNIKNLTKIYNEGKAVEWVRIHRLPDHVYFSHEWHMNAGLTCQDCHGPVETMAVVEQFSRLEMGDCIACHRKSDVDMKWKSVVMGGPESIYKDMSFKYPYMKYVNHYTMSSALIAGMLPAAVEIPETFATGVNPTHNAMTQCSTCHQ